MYEDQKLICEDCGSDFVFSEGEQQFYAEKGLLNTPKRCPACRKAHKKNHRRKMHNAICSKCGKETKVPFKPIEGKEVFCKDCFKEAKEATV